MSQVMEGINARGYLIGWLNGVTSMYIKDIEATPDDVLVKAQGGCARPANELAADTIEMLNWTAEALRGNVQESYMEGYQALSTKLTTKSAMIDALNAAKDNLADAIGQASDETMNAEIMPPWKMPAPAFMMAMIAVNHIWYHDGQLNYIQCLNGDGEVHWM